MTTRFYWEYWNELQRFKQEIVLVSLSQSISNQKCWKTFPRLLHCIFRQLWQLFMGLRAFPIHTPETNLKLSFSIFFITLPYFLGQIREATVDHSAILEWFRNLHQALDVSYYLGIKMLVPKLFFTQISRTL